MNEKIIVLYDVRLPALTNRVDVLPWLQSCSYMALAVGPRRPPCQERRAINPPCAPLAPLTSPLGGPSTPGTSSGTPQLAAFPSAGVHSSGRRARSPRREQRAKTERTASPGAPAHAKPGAQHVLKTPRQIGPIALAASPRGRINSHTDRPAVPSSSRQAEGLRPQAHSRAQRRGSQVSARRHVARSLAHPRHVMSGRRRHSSSSSSRAGRRTFTARQHAPLAARIPSCPA